MGITVVGTTNLAPKRRIGQIIPSTKFPGRWLAVDEDGGWLYITPQGNIMTTDPNPKPDDEGAYQSCRKVELAPGIGTLVYQYGVIAYSEDELF